MTMHYVTLFNQTYFTRGLAMMESLSSYCADIVVTVICFDEETYQTLIALNRAYINPVSLETFESEALKKVKITRTLAEYCWTCTPFSIAYVLEHLKVDSCTYLDADLYFYASPLPLIAEMGDSAVLITPHRYTPRYDQSHTAGIYCVQFMRFTNTEAGLEALTWWQEACLMWCYNRFEDGKFGDQKYLDDWTTRFKKVHVLQHLGGGVAPWNVQQYDIIPVSISFPGVSLRDKKTKKICPVIFYHFHQLRYISQEAIDCGNYVLSRAVQQLLYQPYIRHLQRLSLQFNLFPEQVKENFSFMTFLQQIKRRIKGTYNVVLL